MTLVDSYKNPFLDYNANVMDSSMILDYWCTPSYSFDPDMLSGTNFFKDKMPIIFMGGRGTGKTMLLKYFSYSVQKDEAKKKNKTIFRHLKDRGGIGFYLRFDIPNLNSFKGKVLEQDKWNAIFAHYFGLQVCKLYLDVIIETYNSGEISDVDIKNFVFEASKLIAGNHIITTIEDLHFYVVSQIRDVNHFKNKIAFSNIDFNAPIIFSAEDLCFNLAYIVKKTIDNFSNLTFAILIDEYENYDKHQQRIINTLIKFAQYGVTFRVGMRLEGFHTFDTISSSEHLKETRDYSKYTFDDYLISKNNEVKYQRFLCSVAKKRLESVPYFNNNKMTDITRFLGLSESPEEEAKEIVKDNMNFEILKTRYNLANVDNIKEDILYPNNPLIELLNFVWLMRAKSPKYIKKAMNDYLNQVNSDEAKKYRDDYINKYKLSLVFLLSHFYGRDKKYYSFNTFSRLSSGIVGLFIELCKRSFQYAYFADPEKLIHEGKIDSNIQNKAAVEFANSQLDDIKRISQYGDNIYRLAKNLGNIFREYHIDSHIRYPETTQFAFDSTTFDDLEIKECFEKAIEWSVIQKKLELQQGSIGQKKESVYTLNKIYSPAFKISYRTRGGYNESYNKNDIAKLMKEENCKPQKKLSTYDFNQQSFGFNY